MTHVDADRIDCGDGQVLELTLVSGSRSGPTLAVLGGVHGDELTGIAAGEKLVKTLRDIHISGSVIVVPKANPVAVEARTRCSPIDGLNLARVFPGSQDGSPTERLAFALTQHVISGRTALVDLHTASTGNLMPFLVGCLGSHRRSFELARAFGAPLVWSHDAIPPGRTITVALESGGAAIYVESGSGSDTSEREIHTYVRGVHAVLATLGMVAPPKPSRQVHPRVVTGGSGNLDSAGVVSPASGRLTRHVEPGAQVDIGDVMFTIDQFECDDAVAVRAPYSGTVMWLRDRSPVTEGDGLAVVVSEGRNGTQD